MFKGQPKPMRGIYVWVFNHLAFKGLIPSDMSILSRAAHRELERRGHMFERRARMIAEREASTPHP